MTAIDPEALEPWPSWAELTKEATDKAIQAAAKRGRDWQAMTEEEREEFIDEMLHEDAGNMMPLAETGFKEWDEAEEDIYS